MTTNWTIKRDPSHTSIPRNYIKGTSEESAWCKKSQSQTRLRPKPLMIAKTSRPLMSRPKMPRLRLLLIPRLLKKVRRAKQRKLTRQLRPNLPKNPKQQLKKPSLQIKLKRQKNQPPLTKKMKLLVMPNQRKRLKIPNLKKPRKVLPNQALRRRKTLKIRKVIPRI